VIVCPDCTLLPPAISTEQQQQQLLLLPVTTTTTTGERQDKPPVFCVELKPKQGFLSQGHQHCPFCLNQFLKVRERCCRYRFLLSQRTKYGTFVVLNFFFFFLGYDFGRLVSC
jgi:hypothetical protein